MERLPNEIQLEIFSKLPTEERLTCLFVSKAWNKAAKTCVFNNVTINDEKKLTSAMKYFKKNVDLANQVIDLEINCDNIYQYLSQFQQLFINVNNFRARVWEPHFRFDPKMTPKLGWKKLKYLEIKETPNEGIPPMLQLILSGHCPNLIELCTEVSTSFNVSDPTTMKRCAQIISSLKNAPQLTKLDIAHLSCTINDLERLHQNTPNLRSLTLSTHANIFKTNKPIKPPKLDTLIAKFEANTLTHVDVRKVFTFLEHFEIRFFPSIVSSGNAFDIYALFDFIGKKYWGLQYFSITCNMDYGGDEYLTYIYETFAQAIIENRLLPLFARCPGLTHYDQRFSPLSTAITHEMDECNIQLKTLALYIDDETMEDQLEALFSSQQTRYIQELFIYQNGERDEMGEWPYSRFASMINLKTLHLIGKGFSFCFTELGKFLKHCPQLEEFEFEKTSIDSTEVDMDLPVLALRSLSILELYIFSKMKSKKVETILNNILSHSPKLEKIDIAMELHVEPKPSTFTLDFRTNTKLKRIDVSSEENYKRRYYIKSPKMTGYYTVSWKNGKSRLIKTTPFPPGEHYMTILLPPSVDPKEITIV